MTLIDKIILNEASIRLVFFFSILIIMWLWEIAAPCRKLKVPKLKRWLNNLGLVFLNTIILRLLFPAAAIGMASFAETNGWGILNYYVIPTSIALILSLVILDLSIYLQHVMAHALPVLWRFHRVHHADLDYDVTTGSRFHPFEIILSMLIKFSVIIVVGPPVIAVVVFELLLNTLAMFNHGNVRLPLKLDSLIRLIMVTPDMHRLHHSEEDNEANSNFGFNLSIWDRLFGTYIAQPRAGHENMQIGIHHYNDQKQVTELPGILLLPFVGKVNGYAINRREWSRKTDS